MIPHISTFFIFFPHTMVFIYQAPVNKRQKKPQVKLQLSVMSFSFSFSSPSKAPVKTPLDLMKAKQG
jgi:hypothetical protein